MTNGRRRLFCRRRSTLVRDAVGVPGRVHVTAWAGEDQPIIVRLTCEKNRSTSKRLSSMPGSQPGIFIGCACDVFSARLQGLKTVP